MTRLSPWNLRRKIGGALREARLGGLKPWTTLRPVEILPNVTLQTRFVSIMQKILPFVLCFLPGLAGGTPAGAAAEGPAADLVVYGGTPSGIAAVREATAHGHSAILVVPERFLGGMMAGGLGASDKGVYWTVGGLAR